MRINDSVLERKRFKAIHLNERNHRSWAVFAVHAGEVANGRDGRRLVGMSQTDAEKTAAELNAASRYR